MVKEIVHICLRPRTKGLVIKPKQAKGLKCFTGADWVGSWNANDLSGAHSETGFVIMYASCPIMWGSKLQTLIALSMTDADYIALSTLLHEVIHMMNLLMEIKGHGFPVHQATPKDVCHVFEDSCSCCEIAMNNKT